MMIEVVLALFGTIVIGLGLLLLGLRGRRLNRHPICRLCRFDLQGVYKGPDGPVITCPECGSGLRRPRAIRVGARRRIYSAIVLGTLAFILPLAALVLVGLAMLTGADANVYKPVGVLLFEARHAGPAATQGAAKELTNRLTAGKLSDTQIKSVLNAALEIQADSARPWCPELGDMVETIHMQSELGMQSKLGADEYQRFMNQAAVLVIETRSVVARDDPFPVLITMRESRIGNISEIMVPIYIEQFSVDGENLIPTASDPPEVRRSKSFLFGNISQFQTDPLAILWASSRTTKLGSSAAQTCRTTLKLPQTLAPGRHTVELSVSVQASARARVYRAPGQPSKSDAPFLTHTRAFSVEVLPAASRAIEEVPPDPDLEKKLSRQLEAGASAVSVYETSDSTRQGAKNKYASLAFAVDQLPVPVAFDVFLRVGEREWPIGSFTSGQTAPDYRESHIRLTTSRSGQPICSGTLEDFDARIADVVLRPNPDLAKRTVDLTRIYGGEIVFKNKLINDTTNR